MIHSLFSTDSSLLAQSIMLTSLSLFGSQDGLDILVWGANWERNVVNLLGSLSWTQLKLKSECLSSWFCGITNCFAVGNIKKWKQEFLWPVRADWQASERGLALQDLRDYPAVSCEAEPRSQMRKQDWCWFTLALPTRQMHYFEDFYWFYCWWKSILPWNQKGFTIAPITKYMTYYKTETARY